MRQLPAAPPAQPRLVAARSVGEGLQLDWQPGDGPAPVSWALYRLDGARAPLVATGRAGSPVTAPGAGTYCLSGLDRSGNEGAPSMPFVTGR
jgi:hypothetical protein